MLIILLKKYYILYSSISGIDDKIVVYEKISNI